MEPVAGHPNFLVRRSTFGYDRKRVTASSCRCIVRAECGVLGIGAGRNAMSISARATAITLHLAGVGQAEMVVRTDKRVTPGMATPNSARFPMTSYQDAQPTRTGSVRRASRAFGPACPCIARWAHGNRILARARGRRREASGLRAPDLGTERQKTRRGIVLLDQRDYDGHWVRPGGRTVCPIADRGD